MAADYINFNQSPWVFIGEIKDLEAGFFRFVCSSRSGEKSILIRAREWSPSRVKLCPKPRKADGRCFMRNVPKGKEEQLVKALRKLGYTPERDLII